MYLGFLRQQYADAGFGDYEEGGLVVSATDNGGKIPIPPHMKMEQSVLVKSISVNRD